MRHANGPRRRLVAQISDVSKATSTTTTTTATSFDAGDASEVSSEAEDAPCRVTGKFIRSLLIRAGMKIIGLAKEAPRALRDPFIACITQAMMRKPIELGWQEHGTFSDEDVARFLAAGCKDAETTLLSLKAVLAEQARVL